MTRIRTIVALAVVVMLALTAVTSAAIKIKGGTTQIKLSSAATSALGANHLTATPLAPASVSGSTYSFPIRRGHLKRSNLHGLLVQRGGFVISNGARTVRMRHLTLVSTKRGVFLYAVGRGLSKRLHVKGTSARVAATVARRIGRVTNVHIKNRTATGTLRLSAFAANGINALAGKTIAKRGAAIGSITVVPAFR